MNGQDVFQGGGGVEGASAEIVPVERPDTEVSGLVVREDPKAELMRMEEAAELAPRYAAAIRTLLLAHTFAEDWSVWDDKICLSSAGAERVARQFNYQVFNVTSRKESFQDDLGKGYRYIYEGQGAMSGRIVWARGSFSTRDKLLGYKSNQYRPLEDINEQHIANAALHIFRGNAIKALLGLRGLPLADWKEMAAKAGVKGKAKAVPLGQGTQGGKSKDDTKHQQELAVICFAFVDAGHAVNFDQATKEREAVPVFDTDVRREDQAAGVCVALSSFVNKEGKTIGGKPWAQLRGKWLGSTLREAKKLAAATDLTPAAAPAEQPAEQPKETQHNLGD